MRLPKTEISFQHLAQLVEEYHTTCRRESNEPVGRRLVVWVVCPLEKLGGFCGYSRVQHLKPSLPVIVQSVRTHVCWRICAFRLFYCGRFVLAVRTFEAASDGNTAPVASGTVGGAARQTRLRVSW